MFRNRKWRYIVHYNFSYFAATSSKIKIGRSKECEIRIEDNNLSKYHANIYYTEERGWILEDGYERNPSTNGTWFYKAG